MSISGNAAIALMRLLKNGNQKTIVPETERRKATEENAAFVFPMPKSRKAEFYLLENTERPCLIIRPKALEPSSKAILYIYGGMTNNWKTQRSMAVNYSIASGTEVWYPVYPAISESPAEETAAYLANIYSRMCENYPAGRIIFSGVSMGGLFALEIINYLNLHTSSLLMPGLVIAHSPGGIPDQETDWELMRQYEKRDPLFTEEALRTLEWISPGEGPVQRQFICPSLGDFRNAPPTYLYYGEEMLAGNSVLFQRAYERSGAADQLHIQIVKNMMHGYSSLPVFPESRKSYRETLELIRSL